METYERAGLLFDVHDSGPPTGDVVVLLHGFPQSATSWDGVTALLNDAGMRCLSPDQRGYSPTARPADTAAYRMDALVEDVVALVRASGAPTVRLVGHDWGAAVAWNVAARRPDLVSSLTAVSVPHPAAFAASVRGSTQGLRSWYMALFQTGLAERLLDPAAPAPRERFVRSLVASGQRDDRARRDADFLAEPGAFTAALSWYRAARTATAQTVPGRVRVPTTMVWGARDTALGFDGVRRTSAYVDAPYRLVVLPRASHWVPEEAPDQVAAAVLDPPRPVPEGLPDLPDPAPTHVRRTL